MTNLIRKLRIWLIEKLAGESLTIVINARFDSQDGLRVPRSGGLIKGNFITGAGLTFD